MRKMMMRGALVLTLAFAPHALADPILYASNFLANTITAYNAVTGASLGTVVTGGAELDGANGVRRGPDGSLYVTGQFSNRVVKYNGSTGAVELIFDPANTAGLDSAQGLTFGPDGNIYVVSSANDKILKYDAATGNSLGTFATLGSPHDGPIDLAFGCGGFAYAATYDSDRIVKLDASTGAIVTSFPGPAGAGLADIAIGPDGGFYVIAVDPTDFAGSILRYDTATGSFSTFIAEGAGGLNFPGGLAFDGLGNLLVANLDVDNTILRFNGQNGSFESELVGPGNGLDLPFFVTVATPEPATMGWTGFALLGLGLARQARARTR